MSSPNGADPTIRRDRVEGWRGLRVVRTSGDPESDPVASLRDERGYRIAHERPVLVIQVTSCPAGKTGLRDLDGKPFSIRNL